MLQQWANEANLPAPLANELALALHDVSLAVSRIENALGELVADRSSSPRRRGQLLNGISVALYSALPVQARQLKKPLDQAIRQVYERVDLDEVTLLEEAQRSRAAAEGRLKRQDPVREQHLAGQEIRSEQKAARGKIPKRRGRK